MLLIIPSPHLKLFYLFPKGVIFFYLLLQKLSRYIYLLRNTFGRQDVHIASFAFRIFKAFQFYKAFLSKRIYKKINLSKAYIEFLNKLPLCNFGMPLYMVQKFDGFFKVFHADTLFVQIVNTL